MGTISGYGPAFVDIFLDALGDAGVLNGLSRDQANTLAANMVKGSANLAYETKIAPAILPRSSLLTWWYYNSRSS